MAYTYEEFIRAADKEGLTSSFDQIDLSIAQKSPEYGLSMLSLKKDLGAAQTNEQRLLVNEAMNQLRKNYGTYWTGEQGDRSYASSYGSKINQAIDDIGSYGSFQYSNDNEYKNILDKIINRKEFRYDPATDAMYSSYKKAYNREGDRAAANAMAAAAAATGGRVSSYAATAAQQANNYYAGKLADMIPTLRSQALTEYNNDYAQLLQSLAAMDTDRSQQYQEYNDRLSQMQQDLKNLQSQDASDYQRYLDAINAEYQQERDSVNDEQTQFENALKWYQMTGQITKDLADYLGVAATVPGGSTGSGGYGGGGYSGSKSGNSISAKDEEAQGEADDIIKRYVRFDKDGNRYGVFITDWNDYQRLKEITQYSDSGLNALGVVYAYPTITDSNGQMAPAVAYTKPGGTAVTYEEQDIIAGNYREVASDLNQMRITGSSKTDVLNAIKDYYNAGALNLNDYMFLYKKYRNMDASQFSAASNAAAAAAASNTPVTIDAWTGAAPSVQAPAGSTSGAGKTSNTTSTVKGGTTVNNRGFSGTSGKISSGSSSSSSSSSGKTSSSSGNSSGSWLSGLVSSISNAISNIAGSVTRR